MKGANPNIKNQLGDSPLGKAFIMLTFDLDLAKRYGNLEIVMLYSAQEQSAAYSNGGSGCNMMRKTK
jgi:hypothetical protein